MSNQIILDYKNLLNDKLNHLNLINYNYNDIVDFLYNNNSYDIFILKMYDIFIALDLYDQTPLSVDNISNLFSDFNLLNSSSTYDLYPFLNKCVFDDIEKRKNAEFDNLNYFNTDFICKKCKNNKTTCNFIHKHLGSDEASSLKIVCVNCSYSWYN
tara:strand:- start:861 stop:1328 length:468 start_codon:yes stop_codon:yes gene_type:complete